MRVSIVNLNLEGHDAIGQCILNQTRFFQRRGDEVGIYLLHPAHRVPNAVKRLTRVIGPSELASGTDRHFAASDLYIYHYPGRYPLVESIKTLDRGAVIFYYHNVTPPSLWGSAFERDVLADSLAQTGALAHYADWIVTDSAFNADQLVEEHGLDRERIRVLPLAVALDLFTPGRKDPRLLKKYDLYGKRVILFVGRMAGNKRIDLLIEALAQVHQRVPNAVLLLVGDDRGNMAIQEVVAHAQSRASDLGIAHAVIFTGTVDDLPPYYRLADVYATASLHEGFGVPLIEAMASGVPVVASRATAHPWVVGEAGLLAEAGDACDLASKVVQLLTNDALCGELVQLGRARVLEFSLESYEAGWARIVADATAWLPNQPYPRLRPLQTQPGMVRPSALLVPTSLDDSIQESEASADVMLRSYVVRSGVPLLGRWIAWARRNLTSHLREPYLDPTLERQVAFNRRLVHNLRLVLARLAEYEVRHMEQERRISDVEGQLESPARRLAQAGDLNLEAADREEINRLTRQVQELQDHLERKGRDNQTSRQELR